MEEYIVRVFDDRTEWFNKEGKYHRLDGPAIEYSDGDKAWYQNGERHRLDGPAREWSDGSKEWWVEGKKHRIDGPAMEYYNNSKEWYIEGKYYSTEEAFLKATQPATELTVAEIAKRLGINNLKIVKE
jgi:hypothetical protein